MARFVSRPVLAIAASCFLASCLCNGVPSAGCNLDFSNVHCDSDAAVPNGALVDGWFGSCMLQCSPGWDDCDNVQSNGCEHAGVCPTQKDSGADAGSAVERLGALVAAPMGLAVCDEHVYVVVGGDRIVDVTGDAGASELTFLPTPAAGGIACRGGVLYFGLRSDGVLPGTLIRRDVDGSVSELSASVEPGPGLAVDDAGTVLWPSREDGGLVLTRTDLDGSTSLGPVDDSPVAWPFAQGPDAVYVVASGSLVHLSADAQAPVVGPDAAVVAVAVDDGVSVLALEDASTSFHVLDDGGIGPTLADLPEARALVRYGVDTYVATDASIMRLADDGTQVTLASGQLHVVDLAVAGAWVYWTTLGDGVTAPSVYRVKR